MLALWKESYDKPKQRIKKQRHHFADKGPYGQSYGFSSSHVRIWELNHKKGWPAQNWCFQIVVLEKALESPLDCKEIKPVNPKTNQPWIFTGRTHTEAEALILRSPDAKSWLIAKDPDAGKDWRQEKRMTEDEMVGWHHRLDGHEFEQASGVGDGQGSLACCGPCDPMERVTHDLATEQQHWWIRQLEELHNMSLFIISGRQLNTTSCHLYGSNRD